MKPEDPTVSKLSPIRTKLKNFLVSSKEPFEAVRTIATILALVVAGAWGVYLFWHQEILRPRIAPKHIQVDMDVVTSGSKGNMTSVTMKVRAQNLSKRTSYVLPSRYYIFGIQVDEKNFNNTSFNETRNEISLKEQEAIVRRYGANANLDLAAVGTIFSAWSFEPQEGASRELVVYFPKDEYDAIAVHLILTTVNKRTKIGTKWRTKGDIEEPVPCEIKGDECEILDYKNNKRDQELVREAEYSVITNFGMLSLWQETPEATKR